MNGILHGNPFCNILYCLFASFALFALKLPWNTLRSFRAGHLWSTHPRLERRLEEAEVAALHASRGLGIQYTVYYKRYASARLSSWSTNWIRLEVSFRMTASDWKWLQALISLRRRCFSGGRPETAHGRGVWHFVSLWNLIHHVFSLSFIVDLCLCCLSWLLSLQVWLEFPNAKFGVHDCVSLITSVSWELRPSDLLYIHAFYFSKA